MHLVLMAISTEVDTEAFMSGFETVLYVALGCLAFFVGIAFIRKFFG